MNRARVALVVAAAAGLTAAAVGALHLAHWFDWLAQINQPGETVLTATGDIVGRVGLMTVEVVIALATSLAAVLILVTGLGTGLAAIVVASARLLLTLLLVATHWAHGWYFILDPASHDGALTVLLLGGVQVAALLWSGVTTPRGATPRRAAPPGAAPPGAAPPRGPARA